VIELFLNCKAFTAMHHFFAYPFIYKYSPATSIVEHIWFEDCWRW